MKYGYARVSTDNQNPDLQLTALKQAGCDKTFVDEGRRVAGIWFIWFVWFLWFVWFRERNKRDKPDRPNKPARLPLIPLPPHNAPTSSTE